MPRKKYLINLSDEESEMLLHWNDYPTPFEWGGARAARRERSRRGGHTLGGSSACVRRSIRPKPNLIQKWHLSCQLTH